ncbi:helix-turn-helix domain-containing protein [Novosphingobium aquimarinum]|uniref:helix-turn-helix domain-containing protein n=1 Tax=Novosphingobium aquimarinum TaxID=2682494 RepID=UPI0012EB43F6|nr:helix-turn-helix domain-containing protein [Novosphingobium aquimarinum]
MEDYDDNAAAGSASGSNGSVGATLLAARERMGLSREDVAAQTRIAERHLVAIEENRFGDLAGKTYAVGFSRAYAKTVGLDEGVIAQQVRDQIEPRDYQPRPATSFEPGDPARVPPSALAWIAGIAAIGVFIALFFVWDSLFSPEAEMPSLIADAPPAAAPARQAPQAKPTAAPVPSGGVVAMKAMAPNVWVKVTNAAGDQLFQKELSQGEVYTVPADADAPVLRTGRPDALELTINGQALPRLEDTPIIVSDVPLDADKLRARVAGRPEAPSPPAAAAPSPAPSSPARTTAAPRANPPLARRPAGGATAPQSPAQRRSGASVSAEAAAPAPVSTDSE